jgi:hypothetical protein
MLECLIWQQIWRSLKVGFRGEREKGGGSNWSFICVNVLQQMTNE